MTYTADFYDAISEGCIQSAAAIVPRIIELVNPTTVIDVGCGQGWWAKAFADVGLAVVGVDGGYVQDRKVDDFREADLGNPSLTDFGHFDLAVSLEVAEHLPPSCAPAFVGLLCRTAPVVLFSAAIPHQGGAGHINEQWPGYWTGLFEANGFRCSGALRWEFWDDDRVENWYRANLLLCARPEAISLAMEPVMTGVRAAPVAVVHPLLWESRQ